MSEDIHSDQHRVGEMLVQRVRQQTKIEYVWQKAGRGQRLRLVRTRVEPETNSIFRNEYITIGCKDPPSPSPENSKSVGYVWP